GEGGGMAACVELAGRRFAPLRLRSAENLPRQIVRLAPFGLALCPDRRRRDAGLERRCSKPAAASTQQHSAELRGRASKNGHYKRRRAGCSKPVSGRERQTFN